MTSNQLDKIVRAGSALLVISCVFLFPATSIAEAVEGESENSVRGYEEYTGPYAQFGISIGATEGDDGLPDTDAQGGFNLTGGYRMLPWLAAEANFIFMRGELERGNRDANYFSFTFGPKLFPLGFLDEQPIPEQFQPYMLFAIGGGQYEIEDTSFEEGSFIARFIWGLDWWITDQVGAFVEGGYHVASESDVVGTGVFTFGGQVRF